jgi:hypothetical protein
LVEVRGFLVTWRLPRLAGDTAQRARRFELVREVFLVACRERQL